jgi:hypothetical protein
MGLALDRLTKGVSSVFVMLILAGCGGAETVSKVQPTHRGQMELELREVAQSQGIPYKYLLAVGLYESNLATANSKVPYLGLESVKLGFSVAESAFGINRERLGLAEEPTSEDLLVQAKAYGEFLSKNLQQLNMPKEIRNPTDHYLWLWQLAVLHRSGDEFSRDNRVIWALGLMDVLNTGAVWQDSNSASSLELQKQSPAISLFDFPEEAQKLFELRLQSGEARFTRQLELVSHPASQPNSPTHIEVIHCPFNLSACIEIQNLSERANTARLQAHYIIPANDRIMMQPVQVAPHDYAVEITGVDGATRLTDDAIVVMLAGVSGRYDAAGYRTLAHPGWFTPWQLRELGELSNRLCQSIYRDQAASARRDCLDPAHEKGIKFRVQPVGAEFYQWGQIPDFDETIFYQYVTKTNTNGESVFEFPSKRKSYKAGSDIKFNVRFDITAQHVVLERAIRCPDRKLVWATVQSSPVRAQVAKAITMTAYDAGPNNDGHYFLRMLAYDSDQNLVGWAIDDMFIKNFDSAAPAGDIKACYRNGT